VTLVELSFTIINLVMAQSSRALHDV